MVKERKSHLPAWLILGLGGALFLRLPFLFEPYSYGDECIYLTLGQAIRQGLTLYGQIHDNKPPLLYLLAALSGNLFWFRTLLLLWGLITIFLFYKLSQIIFAKEEKLVKISTLLFSFISSIPLFEAGVANAEFFFIGLTISAFFLLFSRNDANPVTLFLSGILFSLATLFKVPAIFDFAALLVFLLFTLKKPNYQLLISHYFILFLGFSLPILSTLIYFWSRGALNQYLTAAFFQNLPYLSSWGEGPKPRLIILLVITFFLFLERKKIKTLPFFTFLWFAFSLFGATLSGRPYPHYLVQTLPSLSLLITLLFSKLKPKEHFFASFLLAIFFLAFFYLRFWVYPPLTPYRNFFRLILQPLPQNTYLASFGKNVPRNYAIAKFLVEHTKKDERVFVWGDSPCVYALARRLPPGRYTASYHIVDFQGFTETIRAIEEGKTRFIVDLGDENRPFPKLQEILSENYSLMRVIDGAKIFRLNEVSY